LVGSVLSFGSVADSDLAGGFQAKRFLGKLPFTVAAVIHQCERELMILGDHFLIFVVTCPFPWFLISP